MQWSMALLSVLSLPMSTPLPGTGLTPPPPPTHTPPAGVADDSKPVDLPGPQDSVSGAKDNMGAAVGAREEATFNEQKTRWPQVDGARDPEAAEKGIAAKRQVVAQQAEGSLGEGGAKGKEAGQQSKSVE